MGFGGSGVPHYQMNVSITIDSICGPSHKLFDWELTIFLQRNNTNCFLLFLGLNPACPVLNVHVLNDRQHSYVCHLRDGRVLAKYCWKILTASLKMYCEAERLPVHTINSLVFKVSLKKRLN